jgi:hypothetical protein
MARDGTSKFVTGTKEDNGLNTDLLFSHQVTVGGRLQVAFTHANTCCIMTMCISTLAYFVNLLLQHCLGILAASILFALHQSRRLYSKAMSATAGAFNVVSTTFPAHLTHEEEGGKLRV